jgi:LysM repeat protein
MNFSALRHPVFAILMAGLFTIHAGAQMNTSNVQLANLRSDIDRIDQMVRSLRLEVEALRRENRETQEWVKTQLAGGRKDSVTPEQLNSVLREFEQKIQAVNRTSRETLVNEVSKEIEALAEKTQKAINALAKSVEAQPQLQQVVTFSDDYPRTGTSYTVKSGDTLARIARDLGSRVEWIRNANRLASDIIYPGQELFIPLKQ